MKENVFFYYAKFTCQLTRNRSRWHQVLKLLHATARREWGSNAPRRHPRRPRRSSTLTASPFTCSCCKKLSRLSRRATYAEWGGRVGGSSKRSNSSLAIRTKRILCIRRRHQRQRGETVRFRLALLLEPALPCFITANFP